MNATSPLLDSDLLAFARAAIRNLRLVTAGRQRIVSPSGQEQSWPIDLRPVLLNGPALDAIVRLAWKRLPESPFQLCGLETASIPLLTGLVLEGARRGRPINAFVIRKERKDSGLGRDVEGTITDAPIVAIDDITNSSNSRG
jgi:orotate phosphoribosyltransferase